MKINFVLSTNDASKFRQVRTKSEVDPEQTLEAHRMEASVLGTGCHQSGHIEIVEINMTPATVK